MSKTAHLDEYISVVEAAEVIGVSVRQVRRLIKVGTLPAMSISDRARAVKVADARRVRRDRPGRGRPKKAG